MQLGDQKSTGLKILEIKWRQKMRISQKKPTIIGTTRKKQQKKR